MPPTPSIEAQSHAFLLPHLLYPARRCVETSDDVIERVLTSRAAVCRVLFTLLQRHRSNFKANLRNAVHRRDVPRQCRSAHVPGTITVLIWSIESSTAARAALICVASRSTERSVPGGKWSFPVRASCINGGSSAAR